MGYLGVNFLTPGLESLEIGFPLLFFFIGYLYLGFCVPALRFRLLMFLLCSTKAADNLGPPVEKLEHFILESCQTLMEMPNGDLFRSDPTLAI